MRTYCQIKVILFASLLMPVCSVLARDSRIGRNAEDRYQAIWRDGSTKVGKEIRDWYDMNRQPSISGKRLFDKSNPVRIIRDTTIAVKRSGAFVEFANGDVLPGLVISAAGLDVSRGMPLHLTVSMQVPCVSWDVNRNEIAVRPELVKRIVLEGKGSDPVIPGTLLFRDGRKIKVKAMRWATGGVRALTENGSVVAGWLELAEVHPPKVNVIEGLVADIGAGTPVGHNGLELVGRIRASNGAILTYRHSMMRIDRQRNRRSVQFHAIQPIWALEAIRVPTDEIVTRSFRQVDEFPLSLLPSQLISQKSMTGFAWPWRLNASVRSGLLSSGELFSDLGVGTHSQNSVAFTLPAHAKKFSTWVGIDNAVGKGGCVRCRVFLDKSGGKMVWQSDFIRGGQAPVRVGPVDITGAKRLILMTDFGHDKRPPGADPVDIRDEVAWLMPVVHVDAKAVSLIRPVEKSLDQFPELNGWAIAKEDSGRITSMLFWSELEGRWRSSMRVDSDKNRIDQVKPLRLTRKMNVGATNALLLLSAYRDGEGNGTHELIVLVNGEPVATMLNGNVRTSRIGYVQERYVALGAWAGKQIELTIQIHQRGGGGSKPSGIVFASALLTPVIDGLSASGKPLVPDVSITKLKPVNVQIKPTNKNDGDQLLAGKQTNGKPLHVTFYPFNDGYGMPAGASRITYDFDSSWKQFVAVIGMSESRSAGRGLVGPFQLFVDDKMIWQSHESTAKGSEAGFSRDSHGRQLRIDLPAKGKTITLVIDKRSKMFAAWANAGFMKR